jgi:hypothetical protein
MTLREALVILDLSERTLEPSMLNISLKNRLEKTDLRNVTRVLEAYRKVNSFLNPTLDTQGDSKGTVIDEPVEDGPPIQTAKSAVPAMKSETGLRRDYVPVNQPNPTLLGASGHYEAGNTTVMIDPSDAPHQQVDPRQTSILIDDFNDGYQTPAPRVNSRQLAPLAVIGLGLLAFAGGLGGMAVVSKLVNPPPSITTSVTDPADPNTVAIKPNTSNPSTVQNPSATEISPPENTINPTPNIKPAASTPNPNPSSASGGVNQTTIPNQNQQIKPIVPVVKPPTTPKPTAVVSTPEIAATVKPTKTQAEMAQEAQAKAAALEKVRQAQLEKSRLAQVENARIETMKAAQEKARQAKLELARIKANKLALEKTRLAQADKARQAQADKARQAQLEKARQAQLEKSRQANNAQALANTRAKAVEQARINARIKARQQARLKAAQDARVKAAGEARANAVAQEQAKARADQRARVAAQARASAQAKARSQSQTVVVNSSVRNLSNNRSQFYAWDRNGAVLRYGSWSQIPQSIKTARAGTFRASVFVAASPSAMPDIKP